MDPMPITKPVRVDAESGLVIVEGEPGVAISMTPEVALAASDGLLDGAALAIGQRKTAALAGRNDNPQETGETD